MTGPAISALTKWVREKFSGRPLESALLAAAEADPAHAEALTGALDQAAQADPEFGRELRDRWEQIQSNTTAGHGGVANVFHGRAEKVVQLRDLHGDLNIS
ncbi:MAG TPA: hypothetical protein VNW94_30385 [Streptosporangiaceae bacterium]|nr:hypothetical protein [Streptosporangiaceae bacterium]